MRKRFQVYHKFIFVYVSGVSVGAGFLKLEIVSLIRAPTHHISLFGSFDIYNVSSSLTNTRTHA